MTNTTNPEQSKLTPEQARMLIQSIEDVEREEADEQDRRKTETTQAKKKDD